MQIRKISYSLIVLALIAILGKSIPTAGSSLINDDLQAEKDVQILSPIVEPDVIERLTKTPNDPIRVIVIFNSPATSAQSILAGISTDSIQEQRSVFVNELQHKLESSKTSIDDLLIEAQRSGELLSQNDLWIIQGMALTAQSTFIHKLLDTPGIAEIRLDHYRQYLPLPQAETALNVEFDTPTWGLTRIRAPEVWETLGISGTGSVVGIIDTGVEFIHPALLTNYRGRISNALYDHNAAWFDAVNNSAYPYDDYGHGTHVAGIAVGRNNIGVAPDAQWVGIKVLNNEGGGYDSWIHAGFQWILAPNDDPTLAPDIVNASWGSIDSSNTAFEEDIQALKTAGIFPVFASGNDGPESKSVGSPASLSGVFAVGASDEDDDVAYFSGRGPSPWREIKPYIVAPGVNVNSAVPGGIYLPKKGTSMAAPHVAGLAALMHGISPTMSIAAMARVITETAIPLTTTPNNNSGWGRIDAFRAIVAITHPGFVTGTIQAQSGGSVHTIADASITAVSHSGSGVKTRSDANGNYTLALTPGIYDLTASAFGHAAQTHLRISALADAKQQVNFQLLPLPTGNVSGQISISGSDLPPTRSLTLNAQQTPVSTVMNSSGQYTLSLPIGTYTLEARGLGYRVITEVVSVLANQMTLQDFTLTPAPTLLLVDDANWKYTSQLQYWEQALDALRYTYDVIHIKYPESDTPVSTTLLNYDVVLWSSPTESPGQVGGDQALESYLQQGGRVLLSGQNVAYIDEGYSGQGIRFYLRQMLNAAYIKNTSTSSHLIGLGPFSDLEIDIDNDTKDAATNQFSPDEVKVADTDTAKLVWQYIDGAGGGVGTSTCVSHRSLFFSFGYEAISGHEQRQDIMQRSLDWLMTAPLTTGLELIPLSTPMQINLAGQTVSHTLRLRNTGFAGFTETISVTLDGNTWNTSITPTIATIAPCEWVTLTAMVIIPVETGVNIHDDLTVIAQAITHSTTATLSIRTKTPAPVLLVDDDRFEPMEDRYISALTQAQIPFDIWDTRIPPGEQTEVKSLTAQILTRYPLVVWFTANDFVRPVTQDEAQYLTEYLSQAGRLLLSSQDFLYNNESEVLQQLMGILKWTEGQQPFAASGVSAHPASGQWGPVVLDFPYQNWIDVVEPEPEAIPVARGETGQPIAIGKDKTPGNDAKTLFYAFPLETLPFEARKVVLERGVGWLSPLGNSTWTLTPTTPLPDAYIHNTLVLYNDSNTPVSAAITHTLPTSLTLVSGTSVPSQTITIHPLPPGLSYDSTSRILRWTGILSPEKPITLTWTVTTSANVGERIAPTLTFALPDWRLAFNRENYIQIAGDDASSSRWELSDGSNLRAGQPATLTFLLNNAGNSTLKGRTKIWMMNGLTPITATLAPSRGLGIELWKGDLLPGISQVLAMPVLPWDWQNPLRIDALIENDLGQRWEKRLWLSITPWETYLPIILRNP